MEIKRDRYLDKLISKEHNGLIKVITGMRRCGKSYLIFTLFKKHLLSEGVDEDHIIEIAFDAFENKKYRDPDVLYPYLKEQIKDDAIDKGNSIRKQLEIDFVCNQGSKRYYIQSAYAIPDQAKMEQEQRSLMLTGDFFKRFIITKDTPAPYYNESGVLIMSVYDFLLNENSLDN